MLNTSTPMKKKKHQNNQKRPFLKRGEGLKRFQKGNNAFIPKTKSKKKTAVNTKTSNQNRNKMHPSTNKTNTGIPIFNYITNLITV